MHEVFGLPQSLTGAETVTIRQMQGGREALCTMPLSQLPPLFLASLAANLPTTLPATPGVVWNDNGVISIS
jgi:hypothetical protein